MFMAFHTSAKRRPWLIALFATLLIVGVMILLLTRA
jgi:hypothetical protein